MSKEKATTKGFTPGETEIILECFRKMTADPTIEFDAVAATLGYKDASIAKIRFRQIRTKYAAAPASGVDKQSPTKRSPAKPRKAAEKDGDGSTAEKPKRGRKPTSSPYVKKEEDHEVKVEEDAGGAVKETRNGVDGDSADGEFDIDEEATCMFSMFSCSCYACRVANNAGWL